MSKIRAGDTFKLKHVDRERGGREEILVCAYSEGGYVAWCGWPPGEYRESECELVETCTDKKHREMLETWSEKMIALAPGDRRRDVARRQLFELNRGYVGAGI
jgi:hypothetical protein